MFTPVEQAIKEKIVAGHIAGLGRNQITRALHEEGIKVSHGSVSNVIIKYEREHEQSLQSDTTNNTSIKQPPPPQSNPQSETDSTLSAGVGEKKIDSPALTGPMHQGAGLVKITTNTNSRVTTFPEESSSEQEEQKDFKDSKDIEIKNHIITQTQAQSWEQDGHPAEDTQDHKGGPLFWFSKMNDSEVAGTQQEVVINGQTGEEVQVQVSNNYTPPTTDIGSPLSTTGAVQPITTTNDEGRGTNKLVESPKKVYPRDDVERSDRFDIERRAWDYYGKAQDRLLNQINQEKYQRKHELLLIDRRKQKLEEWRTKLEQKESNLKDREAEIIEAQPFLAVAKKLQEMKLALETALPWIETINEVAQMQNLNLREAALYVAQELRFSRQLGGLQRQIEIAQGELKMLNITRGQKQELNITTLLKLNQNGVKDGDIIGLSKIIDLSRMGREWTEPRTGLGQGNNGNNGSSNTSIPSAQQPNGNPGGNFSIWLNLLKSASSRA